MQPVQWMELSAKSQEKHSTTGEQSASQTREVEFQRDRLWQLVQDVLSRQSRQFMTHW